MRKIRIILLLATFTILLQNCSTDEQLRIEENKGKTQESSNDVSDSFSICQITYTFSENNLNSEEKEVIRKWYYLNYFEIYEYTVLNESQELWTVNCDDYESFSEAYPSCHIHGCHSCVRGGCASTPPKDPDPIGDHSDNE